MPEITPVLELDQVSVQRGQSAILHDVSFAIAPGEHTAILGPNGSGKSSLLKLITRQYYPLHRADGRPALRIFGRDRWNISDLRMLLGVVSGDLHTAIMNSSGFDELTGLEAVITGFLASYTRFAHHTVTDTMIRGAQDALALTDAAHLASRQVATLSTGEARRILIARALAPGPRALLLDEPTAGLDMLAMSRFLGTLRGVAASGKTIILVTHHIEEILPEIERVILVKDGRIFRDGAKADLLNSETLSALFGVAVRVQRTDSFYRAHIAPNGT